MGQELKNNFRNSWYADDDKYPSAIKYKDYVFSKLYIDDQVNYYCYHPEIMIFMHDAKELLSNNEAVPYSIDIVKNTKVEPLKNEEMNKEYRVRLLRNYKGLMEGTVLTYYAENNTFGYYKVDEMISDDIVRQTSTLVKFSVEFVERFLGQVFEDMDGFYVSLEEAIQMGESIPASAICEEVSDCDCESPQEDNEQKYAVDIDRIKDLVDMVEALEANVIVSGNQDL